MIQVSKNIWWLRVTLHRKKEKNARYQATLKKSYVSILYDEINRLRVHPDFLKFGKLLGNKVQLPPEESELLKKQPIMESLLEARADFFDVNVFYEVLKEQLYYNDYPKGHEGINTIEKVLPKDSPELAAVLSDHLRRLAEAKKTKAS